MTIAGERGELTLLIFISVCASMAMYCHCFKQDCTLEIAKQIRLMNLYCGHTADLLSIRCDVIISRAR